MHLVELGWLAGIIDGEGSICAYWSKSKTGGSSLQHFISIGMTDLDTMKRINHFFWELTGRKYKIGVHHVNNKPNAKPCYTIRISRRAALRKALELLHGALFLKQRQAALVLKITKDLPLWHRKPGVRVDRPEWLDAIIVELKQLNRRGIPSQASKEEGVETRLSTGKGKIEST